MKMRTRLLLTWCIAQALADSSAREAANPMQKVLQMVSKLQQDIIRDGQVQQHAYQAFSGMCERRSRELHRESAMADSGVADVKSTIEKATTDESESDSHIEGITATLSTSEADLKAAAMIRAKEFAEFQDSQKELLDTISQMERAISILEKQKQGTSFAQESSAVVKLQEQRTLALTQALSAIVDASFINSADAGGLAAFMQSSEDETDGDSQLDAASESYTGGQIRGSESILDTLESLLEKAQASLQDVRSKESSENQNFLRFKGSLERKLAVGTKELNDVKKEKAAAAQARAEAEGDLEHLGKDLNEDKQALGALHHECMTRASDFEDETKSRDAELKALAAAKNALQEMSGGAELITYGSPTPTFFLQTKSGSGSPPSMQAAHMVRQIGQQQNLPALVQAAHRMESVIRSNMVVGADPFQKVKAMLSDMLNSLVKQMQQEATHKVYCDKEMKETKKHKTVKDSVVERLQTKIDTQTSRSMNLNQQVAELQRELLENMKTQEELNRMRQEEHTAFMNTKPELEMGLESIKKALRVLRSYYSQDEEKNHDAAVGAGAGIINMLEIIESDIDKGLASLVAEEETSKAAYEAQTIRIRKIGAMKNQDVTFKTRKAKWNEKAASESSTDLDGVQTELGAINEYLSKIQEECVAQPDSYQERRKRQEEALLGLRNAAEILAGKAVALLQGSRRMRGTLLRQRADSEQTYVYDSDK